MMASKRLSLDKSMLYSLHHGSSKRQLGSVIDGSLQSALSGHRLQFDRLLLRYQEASR
jgi:hypothetical protein